MRKIIFLLSLTLVSWGAFAQHSHSKMTTKDKVQPSVKVEHSHAASAIIENYLALKDALVREDSEKSAVLGKKMLSIFPKFDASGVSKQHKKEVAKIIKDATQQAKYIADNNGNIANQREHFEFLTKGVKDLVIIAGSDRPLYQAYCPMYNNNKGGAWLSTTKEISNPYFGSKMLKCGSVQQELLVK
ncbi:MAG: DUF3347 domain-containing protein [Dysgonamonadaceae bacterium]|nr:DUF3347 domain-containing protein [Dysgonamonadaceae bacterium]